LDEGDDVDLRAFCEANRGTPKVRMLRLALQHYLKHELEADPYLRQRFEEARERLRAADNPEPPGRRLVE
jgi:hypothetical protein